MLAPDRAIWRSGTHCATMGDARPIVSADTLGAITASQVPAAAFTVGFLLVIVAATDILTSVTATAPLLLPLALFTAVCFLVAGILSRRFGVPGRYGSPAIFAMGALLLANDIIRTRLTADPSESVTWMLIVIGAGALMLATPWLIAFILLTLAAWLGAVGPAEAFGEWAPYTRGLLFAAIFSGVVQQLRTAATVRLIHSREAEESLRRQVQQAETEARQEKQWLAAILQAAGEGVTVMGIDGRVVLANEAAHKVLDLDEIESLAPGLFHDTVHPVRDDGTECRLATCPVFGPLDEEPPRGRGALRARNGTRVPVLYTRSSIASGNGTRLVVTAFHDMRGEDDAREAERVAQERFEHLFRQAPVGIAILDREGRFEHVNAALAAFFQRPLEDIMGRHPNDFAHPDDLSGTAGTATAGVLKGALGGASFEKRYLMPNGDIIWGRVTLAPLKDASGSITGALGMLDDITLDKKREAAAAQERLDVTARAEALERANRELEAFSYSASHDLRAPLRAISTLSLILDEELEGARVRVGRDVITRIQTEVARTRQLVDDLMMLSRAGQTDLSFEKVDISAMAAEVARHLGDHATRSVDVTIQPGMTDVCDAGLLRVVYENLLGNAWKYTRDAPSPRVDVGRETQDGETVYYVRDNGIGFANIEAHRIFQAFTRLPGAKGFPGTGVGLATVQRIVQRLGGRIWAEGVGGQGATFSFTLGDNAPDDPQRRMATRDVGP